MQKEFHQSFLLAAGKWSCNACCLVKIAFDYIHENDFTVVKMIEWICKGIDAGYITFEPADIENKKKLGNDNFFVNNPTGFLKMITGKNWTYRFEGVDYIPKVNEYEMDFWAKSESEGKKGIGHFTTPSYNPLQNSETVNKGFIYSKRICKVGV